MEHPTERIADDLYTNQRPQIYPSKFVKIATSDKNNYGIQLEEQCSFAEVLEACQKAAAWSASLVFLRLMDKTAVDALMSQPCVAGCMLGTVQFLSQLFLQNPLLANLAGAQSGMTQLGMN